MNDKNANRPPEGTPEFEEWLQKQVSKHTRTIMGDTAASADFDESEGIAGSMDMLDKTDAELFPDDLQDYMPHERKPRLIHSRNKDKK